MAENEVTIYLTITTDRETAKAIQDVMEIDRKTPPDKRTAEVGLYYSDRLDYTKRLTLVRVDLPNICGHVVWPYTEANVCLRDPHEAGLHLDKRGREFDATHYMPRSNH